jgi:hypothetical protein
VTGRRNIIIAISTIVVFAAMVGFFITLDVSPQIAYARLFIDAGLVIGLMAVVMAFYREKELPTDSIMQGIKNIKSGKYKTRVTADDLGPLSEIALALNELAGTLEEQHEKQEEIKRNLREELLPSLKQKEITMFEHSYHPELGPVIQALPMSHENKPREIGRDFSSVKPEPMAPWPLKTSENSLSNALVDSKPPNEPPKPISEFIKPGQDLGELYQRFIEAQRASALEQTEYALFLRTIEKTKEDLISTYHCSGVWFDIVKESDQVALQPKIVR